MNWTKSLVECAELKVKACIVTRDGSWLGHTTWDGGIFLGNMLGQRWKEFAEPRDLPAISRWLAEDGPGEPIIYRQLCQIGGAPTMCRIALIKSWAGDAWLCVGAVRPLRSRRRLT